MTTLWIFNNHKWAIEDNLVADSEEEHRLYNTDFYNILMNHRNVAVCANALELRQVVSYLTRRIDGSSWVSRGISGSRGSLQNIGQRGLGLVRTLPGRCADSLDPGARQEVSFLVVVVVARLVVSFSCLGSLGSLSRSCFPSFSSITACRERERLRSARGRAGGI